MGVFMYKATFEVEAVTPIFMRGANQKEVEIRSSSIKGLVRWWFRALAGNYFGDNINKLRDAENAVFGSTGERSRVIVEVNDVKDNPKKIKNGELTQELQKLQYLWFSIKILSQKHQMNYYYPRGSIFRLTIKSHDEKPFKLALTSFWALVVLGGIGFRNRRGAGSLKFVGGNLNALETLGLKTKFTNLNDFKLAIDCAIDIVGNNLRDGKSKLSVTPTSYAILNENTSCVGLLECSQNNPIDQLVEIQSKYSHFRRDKTNQINRIMFGLPIVKSNIKGSLGKIIRKKRRSSPMFIGVTLIGSSYHIKVIKFRTNPYHPESPIEDYTNWNTLKKFNYKFENLIFGSLEVFE